MHTLIVFLSLFSVALIVFFAFFPIKLSRKEKKRKVKYHSFEPVRRIAPARAPELIDVIEDDVYDDEEC